MAQGPNNYGLAKGVVHQIDTGDSLLFWAKPYCKSQVEDAQISKELKQLFYAGLLAPLQNPWASLLLILKKKDGGHQIGMDYCSLNSVTKKDSYPLPRIDNALRQLSGSKFFSAMDLALGYWQVDLSPKDREKAALITSEGLFESTCMPQGLCNAPATFQRAMYSIL